MKYTLMKNVAKEKIYLYSQIEINANKWSSCMGERKIVDHLDIFEGENNVMITTTVSCGLELVDAVDDYIKQGFTVASSSSGGTNIQVYLVKQN